MTSMHLQGRVNTDIMRWCVRKVHKIVQRKNVRLFRARNFKDSNMAQRLLHAMLNVKDLDASIAFYKVMGMHFIRRREFPEGKFTLVYLGYGDERNEAVLELSHDWGQEEPYTHGTGYGHIALGTNDIYGLCDRAVAEGYEVTRPAGVMKGTTTCIAFLKDPDGYSVELIDTATFPPPPDSEDPGEA